jgi:cytochrome b6-f complex iron-sulfur subunit
MTPTRRVVLQTIAASAAGCMMAAACGGEDGGDKIPSGKATMCGNNACISLAENPELTEIGGILLFTLGSGQTFFVMRVSETELRALTAICTHQSCTVEWDTSEKFVCPCHGSQFDATGAVLRGPAATPLRTFNTMLAGDTLTVVMP